MPAAKAAQVKDLSQIERDRRDQQQQEQNDPWLLQLKGPANGHAACAQRQQRATQSKAGQNNAQRIGQRLLLGCLLIAACTGKAHGLEADDWKDTRHDIEQQTAQQSPAKRQKDCCRIKGRAGGRDCAGPGNNFKPAPSPCGDDAPQFCHRRAGGFGFDDDLIAIAHAFLRCCVAQGIFGFGVEPGGDRWNTGGQGQSDAQDFARLLKTPFAAQGHGKARAPLIK